MLGKTVVITGGTSGLGEAAATQLAAMGARIVLIARDRTRAAATLARLAAAQPRVQHAAYYADLSSLAQTRRVAAEVALAEPRIDVLLNNVGALHLKRRLSVDGVELTLATNVLSHFVLTAALDERLRATPGARVVITASKEHAKVRLDLDDLQSARRYKGYGVYQMTKLCNVLHTRELARRLDGSGVTVNCVHPGVVGSRIGENNFSGAIGRALRTAIMATVGVSPTKGGRPLVHLASAPELASVSGAYFDRLKRVEPAAHAQDDVMARRLWDALAELASREGVEPKDKLRESA